MVTKVNDSAFLHAYDVLKAAGFSPRSAAYVANYVIHYTRAHAIAFLRATSQENLKMLHWRQELGAELVL